MKRIAIIDAGIGNIRSVYSAFDKLGCIVDVVMQPPKKDDYDIVVIPGAGSAGYASKMISKDVKKWIVFRSEQNKTVFGICLGFQLMLEGTDEDGGVEGLSLIPGVCKELSEFEETPIRVGWNPVIQDYLSNLQGTEHFYFNHAYGLNKNIVNKKKYLNYETVDNSVAWIRNNNIIGVQFHPEKSQFAGRKLLGSLLEGL